MSWWDDALHRATVEVLLVGAVAGIVGVQVVLRRLSFLTMALTHATFPGVVIASLIGVNLVLGGAVAGVVVALAVAALSRRPGQNSTAATGVLLSAGFALGTGLVATQSGGFSRDLSGFLVGSILTVDHTDLRVTAGVLVVVAVVLLVGARPLLASGFDPVGARAAGLRPGAWDLVLLLTLQITVVTLVPAVGTILAVALLVAPAAAARLWSGRVAVITALAVVFAMLSGLVGLWASARWNVAAGAAITLTATAVLLISAALTSVRRAPTPPAPGLPALPAPRSPADSVKAS